MQGAPASRTSSSRSRPVALALAALLAALAPAPLSAADPPAAGFELELRGPDGPWPVGAEVTLELRVRNGGGRLAGPVGLSLVDTLPAGLVPLAASRDVPWDCEIEVQEVRCAWTWAGDLPPGPLPAASIRARVVSAEGEPHCARLTAAASAAGERFACQPVPAAPAAPSLSLLLRAVGGPWRLGGGGRFELLVQNFGPPILGPAGIVLQDTLPDGLVPLPRPAEGPWDCAVAGQTVACAWRGGLPIPTGNLPPAAVEVSVREPVVEANCASVTVQGAHYGPDATPADNRACVEVAISRPPDLAVVKAVLNPPWAVGGDGVFQFEVLNLGPPLRAPARIRVTDTLPEGLTALPLSGAGPWRCAVEGRDVACDWAGPLPVETGALPAISLAVHVEAVPSGEGCARIEASCVGEGLDANAANNRSCATVEIGLGAARLVNLGLANAALDTPWAVGGRGRFALEVSNRLGPIEGPIGIRVEAVLPIGLTPIEAPKGAPWNCALARGSQLVACDYAGPRPVPSGPLPPVVLGVRIEGAMAREMNCATVSHSGAGFAADADPADNEACAEVAIAAAPTPPTPPTPTMPRTAAPTPPAAPVAEGYDLALGGAAPKACVAGAACRFDFEVTNRGASGFDGLPVLAVETVPPDLALDRAGVSEGLACAAPPFRCRSERRRALAPGEAMPAGLAFRLPAGFAADAVEVCATLLPGEAAVDVGRLQAALNARGYDAGAVDGRLGPGTASAIRQYQSDNGLPVTGAPSPALLARLGGVAAGDGDAGNDRLCLRVAVAAAPEAEAPAPPPPDRPAPQSPPLPPERPGR